MDEGPGLRSISHQASVSASRTAEVAESLVSTLERLADTYRWMAEGTRSPDKARRLREHVARLEHRADEERAEVVRLRGIAEA